MKTQILVVKPMFSVIVDETGDVHEDAPTCEAHGPLGAGYEANGQILARLTSLLQNALQNAPQLITEITTLIALFGGKPVVTPAAK